jgi:uncharacterized NAD-dependent epimerase/dehydratase family protein
LVVFFPRNVGTSEYRFEIFISNGLSSFLDSQEEKHISQAIEVVERLETVFPYWTQSHLLYTLGCIMSRAGQLEKALEYIKQALEKGENIYNMKKDTDFKVLWKDPRFLDLGT